MTALAVKNLSKSYGGVHAVQDVSLALEKGERRVVIGPNGAGKTTLFHAISGTVYPSSGSIDFFGVDVTRYPPNRRAKLGLSRTFQVTNLFAKLTVRENVQLAVAGVVNEFGMLFPISSYPGIQSRTRSLLEEWGLSDDQSRLVQHLSYGDQRKLEIVLALAGAPKLILFDEPMAGLSPAETSRVLEMVRKLPRDITILMIEHDMDVAFEVADRITVLHQGRLVAEGDQSDIRSNSMVKQIYLGME